MRGDIFLKSKATLVFKKPSTASFAPFCNENYATTAIPQDFFEHFVEEYVLNFQPFLSRGTHQLADNTMRNKMLLHLKTASYLVMILRTILKFNTSLGKLENDFIVEKPLNLFLWC